MRAKSLCIPGLSTFPRLATQARASIRPNRLAASHSGPCRGRRALIVALEYRVDPGRVHVAIDTDRELTGMQHGRHCWNAGLVAHTCRLLEPRESCCERWGSQLHALYGPVAHLPPERLAPRLFLREAGQSHGFHSSRTCFHSCVLPFVPPALPCSIQSHKRIQLASAAHMQWWPRPNLWRPRPQQCTTHERNFPIPRSLRPGLTFVGSQRDEEFVQAVVAAWKACPDEKTSCFSASGSRLVSAGKALPAPPLWRRLRLRHAVARKHWIYSTSSEPTRRISVRKTVTQRYKARHKP